MQKLPEQSRSGWESFVSGKVKVIKIHLTLKLNKINNCFLNIIKFKFALVTELTALYSLPKSMRKIL